MLCFFRSARSITRGWRRHNFNFVRTWRKKCLRPVGAPIQHGNVRIKRTQRFVTLRTYCCDFTQLLRVQIWSEWPCSALLAALRSAAHFPGPERRAPRTHPPLDAVLAPADAPPPRHSGATPIAVSRALGKEAPEEKKRVAFQKRDG